MKKIAFILFMSLFFGYEKADAQMVTVLEFVTQPANVMIDSVWVIHPNGNIDKYEIARATNLFPITTYKRLNEIFNGIISQGYKPFLIQDKVTLNTKAVSYFVKPWTPASSELEQVETSHLHIKGYPNPTDGIVALEIDYVEGYIPTELIVVNEAGFIVKAKEISIKSGQRITLDLAGLNAGIYFIIAKNDAIYSASFKCIVK